MDSIPITFKEIIPDHNAPEKWREIVLNTGGTHSTLQDIKLPQRAGGYCYEDSKHPNTRNRLIYWQTTSDSIELSEASLDRNLSGAHLRCRVAAGTPPLDVSVWERARDVVVLAATVSSVHRLQFPRPLTLEDKASFGAHGPSLSIFHDATTAVANSPANYFILPQYSTTSGAVAHACASLLRASGEAVWALAWRRGAGAGDAAGGLAVARLPAAGAGAPTLQHLRRESAVPRFLSGITGALRGKGGGDAVETSGVVVAHEGVVAVCADTCLRVWSAEDGGAPLAVSPPLAVEPSPHAQGHRLQRSAAADGALVLVSFVSSPCESEFVVTRVERDHTGVRFTNICRLYGAQLELVEYRVGAGEGSAVWALWSRPDGDSLITTSSLGAAVEWRAVAAREPPAALPALPSHHAYRDRLFAPGLFPVAVIKKALAIYRRTWGGGAGGGGSGLDVSGAGLGEGDVREAALVAVQARLAHLAARPNTNQSHLMHRCWSDLYSWCVQYMEGLQKPLGLMVSKHEESGWWCGVVRRGGISFVRALSHLERLLLAPDLPHTNTYEGWEALSAEARTVLTAGARWERWLGGGADELERRLFSCAAPQHRLLPRLLHLLAAPPDDAPPTLTPQNIDDLTAMLEPIQDLQKAVLELNEVLKLEVPDLDLSNSEDAEHDSEYDTLFSSDLGVSVLTEAIRQMAEMRGRMVRGVVGALVAARGADGVPGAGHCVVHWQAYRALLWLRSATLQPQQLAHSDEQFRLKLSVLGVEGAAAGSGGAAGGYAAGAGGARARRHLAAARAPPAWHAALPLMAHHLAHQMWAVSGGFEFGWWLASINQPKLVQSYVALLEPWCEWNACSRQFILGMSLLDTGDAEGAYTAFCKAAKGVSGGEPLLQRLVRGAAPPATPHRALVLYYLHVIRLFEIHDAGACVVRLAETAISIADRDDPNLAMFQWLVFKWHLAGGRVERALCAAAANPAPHARANAAATLLTTLASRKQLGALVGCAALAAEAERAAAARAKLHDAHAHNPYYSFLYALHVARSDYRKAGAVMYERAARCAAEGGGARRRRRCLLAALTCLRLARPEHAFLTRPGGPDAPTLVLRPEELARELRELDAQHADTRHNVETLLPEGDNIDFEELRHKLKNANAEALHMVAKRLLSLEQFLPHWLLTQYMEVDSGGCVRTLLASGRAVEAAHAATECVRATLRTRMTAAHAAPPCCPLAALDLLRAELREHLHDARAQEAYEELEAVVEEYVKVVTRTSDAIKQARIQFPVAS